MDGRMCTPKGASKFEPKVYLRKAGERAPAHLTVLSFKNKTCSDVTKPDLDVIQENFQRSKETWIYLQTESAHGIPGWGAGRTPIAPHQTLSGLRLSKRACSAPTGAHAPSSASQAWLRYATTESLPALLAWWSPPTGLSNPSCKFSVLPRTDFSLVFCPCYCCITSKMRRVAVKSPSIF